MPIPEEIRNLKIAPLGNFHDINNLPTFYQNCNTPQEDAFEQTFNIINRIPYGANRLVNHTGEQWTLFFDSYSHVLMSNNRDSGVYDLKEIYRSEHQGDIIRPVVYLEHDLGDGGEGPAGPDGYDQVISTIREQARLEVTQIFTTQISVCSFQVVFIGEDATQPDFILFSHLQNRSKLIPILENIQRNLGDVLAIMNICCPDAEAVLNACYGFLNNQQIRNKTVTFLRDSYLWSRNSVQSGFALPFVGMQLAPHQMMRLASKVSYGGLFGTATMINIERLPIFNDTPENIQNDIRTIRPLLLPRFIWRSKKRLDAELARVSDYYFDLFTEGRLGDGYFIREHFAQLETLQQRKALKQQFLTNFSRENIGELQKTIPFRESNKYICWDANVSMENIITQIQEFEPPDIDNIYFDLGVESVVGENVRRTFSRIVY